MSEKPASLTLHLSATVAAESDPDARTLTGLAVPFGPVGNSSYGPVTFAKGSLLYLADKPGRVKLLRQHDPAVSLGHATSLQEREDGLYAAFSVAPGPEGDLALAEAKDGRRDGLSVGVRLDDATLDLLMAKLWDGDTTPTPAAGQLLEISQVSIPAFQDARTDGSLAASHHDHLTLAVTFDAPTTPNTVLGDKEIHMSATKVETPAPVAVETPAPAPALVAGAAVVTSEPPIYTFNGQGASFVRDAYNVRFASGDREVFDRFDRFNAQLRAGAPVQTGLLTAAVETRATAPGVLPGTLWKPDLLAEAVDKGRPLMSRLSVVQLTDATPYRVPVEQDFYRPTIVTDGATTAASTTVTSATSAFTTADIGRSISGGSIPTNAVVVKVNSATSVVLSAAATATAAGVTLTIRRPGISDHTEGQSHTTEGDQDVTEVTVTPGAVSGAFRLSREMVDASNPALDQIALRSMMRDYRYQTETKTVAMLDAGIDTTVTAQNTNMKVRTFLSNFYDLADEPAAFMAFSGTYYNLLTAEVDSTGRPLLPSANPTNAIGETKAGWTGVSVDGVEYMKSSRIDAETAYAVIPEDVHVAEATPRSFRFEEVEGPGVVKLALWGYWAGNVLRVGAVRKAKSV